MHRPDKIWSSLHTTNTFYHIHMSSKDALFLCGRLQSVLCCEKIMHVRSFCMQWTQHAFYIDYTQWLYFDLYFIWQVNVKNFVLVSVTLSSQHSVKLKDSAQQISTKDPLCVTQRLALITICVCFCVWCLTKQLAQQMVEATAWTLLDRSSSFSEFYGISSEIKHLV